MTKMLSVDPRFAAHFSKLKQVFLYLVDRCNLRCTHCLYKSILDGDGRKKEIGFAQVLALLNTFRSLGASKLTIMGGEPTLYDEKHNHEMFFSLIERAKLYGYEYIRMDTNGLFPSEMLMDRRVRQLDEITFSLDGPSKDINDGLRGKGVFDRCVANIRKAVASGYNVNVTCCVHRGFTTAGCAPSVLLDRFILLMESIGVQRVNFRPVFKMGIARDTWSGDTDISPDLWIQLQRILTGNIDRKRYAVPVRVPKRFATDPEFDENPDYYGYCSAKLGERVLVHPDGTIRICALHIGTSFGVAKYDTEKIVWNDESSNELRQLILNKSTPCSNQRCTETGLVPLCISFKPNQDEFVWKEKLVWERRREAVLDAST